MMIKVKITSKPHLKRDRENNHTNQQIREKSIVVNLDLKEKGDHHSKHP